MAVTESFVSVSISWSEKMGEILFISNHYVGEIYYSVLDYS